MPYSVRRYDYVASFWVKVRPQFGAHVRDLNDELRQRYERNRGVVVDIVIKGSPAYEADVLPGDVIIALGDEEISDTTSFVAAIKRHAGRSVEVELIRGDKRTTLEVKLNKINSKPPAVSN